MRGFRYAIATLLVLPLLAILLVLLFLKTPMSGSFLESQLRQWVHPELQINGGVEIDVLGGLQVQARDVVIPSATGGQLLVTIDQMKWRMGWWPLLSQQIHISDMGLTGVRVFEPADGWQAQLDAWQTRQTRLPQLFADVSPDGRGMDALADAFQLDRLVLEGLALMPEGSQADTVPLWTLDVATAEWLPAQSPQKPSRLSIAANQIVAQADVESRAMPAFLEQLGLPPDESFVIQTLRGEFDVRPGLASVRSLSVRGSWGQLSAQEGTVKLPGGELNMPLQADLANGVNWRSQGGVQIRTRQARLRFELTGTVGNVGVMWQR